MSERFSTALLLVAISALSVGMSTPAAAVDDFGFDNTLGDLTNQDCNLLRTACVGVWRYSIEPIFAFHWWELPLPVSGVGAWGVGTLHVDGILVDVCTFPIVPYSKCFTETHVQCGIVQAVTETPLGTWSDVWEIPDIEGDCESMIFPKDDEPVPEFGLAPMEDGG